MGVRTIVEVDENFAADLEMADIRGLVRNITDPDINEKLEQGPVVVAPGVRVLARRRTSEGLTVKVNRGPMGHGFDEPAGIELAADNARSGMSVGEDNDG